MATCLFTGEQLHATTRVEHTIPESFGGRIRSQVVSSSAFNERAGHRVDGALASAYSRVLHALAPLLPAAARPGRTKVRSHGLPGHELEVDNGTLTLPGVIILDRNEAGRPKTLIHGEEVRPALLKSCANGRVQRTSTYRLPDRRVVFPEVPVLHWSVDAALLKSLLLTFDHLLAGRGLAETSRFTRHPSLDHVRRLVCRAVDCPRDTDSADVAALADIALGVQHDPEVLARYTQLMERAGASPMPFAHVLIASANPATHTLDTCFWAFGHEAHAYRLCDRWSGEPFTWLAINGILDGHAAAGPLDCPQTVLLGRPNHRRCWVRTTRQSTDAERWAAVAEISAGRDALMRRAVDHVERTADADLVGWLLDACLSNPNYDCRLTTAMLDRWHALYTSRADAEPDRFLHLLAPLLDGHTPDQPPGADANSPGWVDCLTHYRAGLDRLAEEFGLPGETWSESRRCTPLRAEHAAEQDHLPDMAVAALGSN